MELFGWKMEKFPSAMEYWMIQTQEGLGGGMMKREQPDQKIVDYFGVLCPRVLHHFGEARW
jgi:uncharacterized protein